MNKSEREFLAKMAMIVDEYETDCHNNRIVGAYVDLGDGQPIQEWDGEKFGPRDDLAIVWTKEN